MIDLNNRQSELTLRGVGHFSALHNSSSRYVRTPILQSITEGELNPCNKFSNSPYSAYLIKDGITNTPVFTTHYHYYWRIEGG